MQGAFIIGIAIIVLFAIMRALRPSPFDEAAPLSRKFINIGPMTGMNKTEIITRVEKQPSSISNLPEGKQLLQWEVPGYHIAIRFLPDGTFDGITHQYAKQ